MKQTQLLQSGCQKFNRDILDSAGDHFAYCSNLAIYIYSLSSKRLKKIIPAHSKHLAGVSFSQDNSDVFATAAADLMAKRWHVNDMKELSSIQLPASPVMLEWCNVGELVAILLTSGQVLLWTDSACEVISGLGDCSRIRWDHKRESGGARLAVARQDGTLCIWNAAEDTIDEIKLSTDVTRPVGIITDLQWDPISNNYVLVSSEGGDMYLVDTEQMLCQGSFQSDARMLFRESLYAMRL
jgi:WD40 repeat protein